MKPTEEQIKEFWEWCGWKDAPGLGLISPDGEDLVPPIDLNSLFKYADLILDRLGEHYIILQKRWNDYSIKEAEVVFVDINKYPYAFTGEAETYALALFWAIYEVIKGS